MIQRITNRVIGNLAEPVDRLFNKKWYDFPLGRAPKAEAQVYAEIANEAKSQFYGEIDRYEQLAGFAIEQPWLHELALHTQIVIKKSKICYQHGRLLYSTLRKYIEETQRNYVTIVETGTARGFSALCMAKALSDSKVDGRIVTFDVLPHNTKMYWNCIQDAQGPKSRKELLRNYSDLTERYIIFHQGTSRLELPKVQFEKVNFAFLDAVHDYKNVKFEFDCIRDKQGPADILFFDDYTPEFFPGVVQAADEICTNYGYAKTKISISNERGYAIARKS